MTKQFFTPEITDLRRFRVSIVSGEILQSKKKTHYMIYLQLIGLGNELPIAKFVKADKYEIQVERGKNNILIDWFFVEWFWASIIFSKKILEESKFMEREREISS